MHEMKEPDKKTISQHLDTWARWCTNSEEFFSDFVKSQIQAAENPYIFHEQSLFSLKAGI
jgi:hypothetical protein